MKKLPLIFIVLITLHTTAQAKLNILTCEPEWKSLAKEIGGNKIKTHSATTAYQDPHHLSAKPSLIAKARSADLLFCSGAGLEVGWLPILLRRGGNPKIQPNQPGHLMAADFVETIERPTSLDRAHGDVHPQGNPHIHLNPHNIQKVANELLNRLKKIDPKNASIYTENHSNFTTRWQEAINKWHHQATNLKNFPLIVQHKSWSYLINWLNLNLVATIEPKPGIPPTTKHLNSILTTLKSTPAKIIIHTPYESNKPAKWLHKKSSIPLKELPYTVNPGEDINSLFDLYGTIIKTLNQHAK